MQQFPLTAGRAWALRLAQGEDLLGALESFAAEQKVQAAFITGIGAVAKAILAYYRQLSREYEKYALAEPLELLSCIGNLSWREGEYKVHLHGIFSRNQGETIGGHIMPGTIVTAAEIMMQEYTGAELIRKFDETTGMFLWQ